jgi:hypothetical protein
MPGEFDVMSSELLTLAGATVPPATSGTFTLYSDILAATGITIFVIPKGMTLKLWSRLVSGPGVTVNYQFANNGVTFRTIVSDVLGAVGEVVTEKRRPHVFRSSAGTEAVQIVYAGANPTTASEVVFDAEVVQD